MPDEPDRKERRAQRLEERAARLDALLAAMEGDRDPGPIWRIVEGIERDLDTTLPGPLGDLERALGELGVDDDDLPGGERVGTLRLAFAISRELGRRLPLDTLLGVLPGLPGGLAEKGLLLPLSFGLATAYRLRTDPQALARRARRMRQKRARLAARLQRGDDA